MAKSEVSESDRTAMSKVAVELKKELQRLVKAIVEDDDCRIDRIDEVLNMLSNLKEFKRNNSFSKVKLEDDSSFQDSVPDEFRCHLSKKLMRDPVILATGQTYDRPFIQKWLKSNRTCPRTQQVLTHTNLTPNLLIREMIVKWCTNRGIELPDITQYSQEDGLTEAERDHFLSLLGKMSLTLPLQKEAAKELRSLTKRMPSFRALFGESLDAISQLLNPLSQSQGTSEVHPELQEDIITTLLNLSIHDSNKKLVAETPIVIPLLIDALKSGNIDTRTNAAATLFTLSAIDSNKSLIGESGALKPLIGLLEEGHSSAMKDVASAIFNLCINHENKSRAVGDGVVKVILTKIMNRTHVDELLAILAMLSTHPKAIQEMIEYEAVPCLLGIIGENGCDRNKENCIAVLHTICLHDRTKLKVIREEERLHKTISELAQKGTSRAKRKASVILDRLNRASNITHTA